MADVTINLRPNGPLLVSGPITLNDTQGNSYNLAGKETVALCRCAHSKNRPFCDGTHKTCGFEGQETIPAP